MSASLKDKLTEVVNRHWKVNGTAFLLSTLGPTLSAAGYNHRMILGETKLSEYISRECRDSVTIISHPNDSQILGVLPVDVSISGNDLSYLFAKRSDKQGPRYQRGTWAAFLVDLRPKFRRFVSKAAPFEFKDTPEFQPFSDDNYIEVDRKFIKLPYEDIVPAEKTRERLEAWGAEKQIDLNIFAIHTESAPVVELQDSQSIMHLILSSLTSEEMSRIQMPLDVVKKLLDQRKVN